MVKPLCFFNIFIFRTLLVRVCIKIAYLSKYTPRSSRKHILANHVQQKSNFSDWMCLRMPSCRIWAAKQISKIPCKYIYYLHMGRSWGPLKFFDALNFLMFVLFYFCVLVSRAQRLADMKIFSFARGKLGQMSSYFFVFFGSILYCKGSVAEPCRRHLDR